MPTQELVRRGSWQLSWIPVAKCRNMAHIYMSVEWESIE